jgi:hypothetical protein
MAEQEQRPGYYAVIPADVRYDDRLPANAKLLYGEITALANAKGFCYASNDYFCQLYGFSERTISRLFGALESSGYIRREVERDKDGTVTSRKIWISVSAACAHPVDNFDTPSRHFCQDPPDKNVQENNTGEYISIPPISPEKPKAERKARKPKTNTQLDDTQTEALIRQNVATLGDASGWSRGDKNDVYKLAMEFYQPRDCSGSPPRHTTRGINGLFRRLSEYSRGDAQAARGLLNEAIERGWTSVYPEKDRGRPQAPAPAPDDGNGVYKRL